MYGITQPSKSPQETLMETCNAILTSVDLLKKSMSSLEASLDRHSDKLDQVSHNMEVSWNTLDLCSNPSLDRPPLVTGRPSGTSGPRSSP